MPQRGTESGRSKWTRIVYVIDLTPAACARCPNDAPHKPVYVGQTAQPAAERFRQHKDGYKASKWVRNYGLRVNSSLSPAKEYETVKESEAAERRVGRKLRNRGYCVYGAH